LEADNRANKQECCVQSLSVDVKLSIITAEGLNLVNRTETTRTIGKQLLTTKWPDNFVSSLQTIPMRLCKVTSEAAKRPFEGVK
jgi:hypothetical protein